MKRNINSELLGILTCSRIKHLIHCATFVLFSLYTVSYLFSITQFQFALDENSITKFNPWRQYGVFGSGILYLFRIFVLLVLPQVILNIVGMFYFNAFPEKVTLKSSPLFTPIICIRTVTRGNFPQLVCENVVKNMAKCTEAGMENFLMEVVTDKPIQLPNMPHVREIVVPSSYKPRNGALYKARALEYCLQDEVNVLTDNDYIVHLDEETIMTTNAVRGILNFIMEGKYEFGQGLITYANDPVINWITTLADSIRVADDMGKLRAQFYLFHKPILSWKGSFIVSRVGAEKDISFDHGINGSIAEDCYFAMRAYMKGYTFDFIDGEMWEKSPFTMWDFIQQRKRWVQGITLVVLAHEIAWKYKIWLAFSLCAWITMPLTLSNIFLGALFPVPVPNWLNILMLFVGSFKVYMYIFGVIKSLSFHRLGIVKYASCFIFLIFIILLSTILETTAVLMALFSDKSKFYIVNKDPKVFSV